LLENQSGVKKKIEKEVFGADIPPYLLRQEQGMVFHIIVLLRFLARLILVCLIFLWAQKMIFVLNERQHQQIIQTEISYH
jgi:hypothetical protein